MSWEPGVMNSLPPCKISCSCTITTKPLNRPCKDICFSFTCIMRPLWAGWLLKSLLICNCPGLIKAQESRIWQMHSKVHQARIKYSRKYSGQPRRTSSRKANSKGKMANSRHRNNPKVTNNNETSFPESRRNPSTKRVTPWEETRSTAESKWETKDGSQPLHLMWQHMI